MAKLYRNMDFEKNPVVLVQIVKEDGENFLAYGDKESNSFVVTNEEWLSKNFSSYDVDKEKNNGREIWDLTEYLKEKSDYFDKEDKEDNEDKNKGDLV